MIRIFLLVSFFCNAFHARAGADTARKEWKVLFIGNSLTYSNDLPSLVAGLARLDGKTWSTHSIALPDHSLEDHWNQGAAVAAIEKEKYDLVIVQQGPSAAPASQAILIDYAGRFAEVCSIQKTKMALYMVWPAKNRLFDLDNVIKSYSNAAIKSGAIVCPAGLAWKQAWQLKPGLALYGPDQFHPGLDGSLLAAMTIYAAVTGKKDLQFVQWEKSSWKNDISKEIMDVLKMATLRSLQ